MNLEELDKVLDQYPDVHYQPLEGGCRLWWQTTKMSRDKVETFLHEIRRNVSDFYTSPIDTTKMVSVRGHSDMVLRKIKYIDIQNQVYAPASPKYKYKTPDTAGGNYKNYKGQSIRLPQKYDDIKDIITNLREYLKSNDFHTAWKMCSIDIALSLDDRDIKELEKNIKKDKIPIITVKKKKHIVAYEATYIVIKWGLDHGL